MKLHILILTCLIASPFWSAAADQGSSLRGLKGKKNFFVDEKAEEEPTNTTPTSDDPTTSITVEETATTALANAADDNDEYIEVDVALIFTNSVSAEDQRQVNLALMDALNELGIGLLTEGIAPTDAIMTLDSFSMEATGELRRRLGTYSRYICPCRRCSGSRRDRRDLKKSPGIKKTLEDKLNKILREQGIEQKIKVDDIQYFQFEKQHSEMLRSGN